MTQEIEDLLLKDICARTPYGIKCEYDGKVIDIISVNLYGEVYPDGVTYTLPLDKVKPYLRPMSSMTEEEKAEYVNTCYDWYDTLETYDWLNKHHFDYRGLIEKGLALEAPEGMYKI